MNILSYQNIPQHKRGFIFELDNVLYDEKDYLIQVYYLFSEFLEYTESYSTVEYFMDAFIMIYVDRGPEEIFDIVQGVFDIHEKYRENFNRLHKTAKLPNKVFLYKRMVPLLQDIVIERKKLFIITNGDPDEQLNKIKNIEWHGLESYFTVYFAQETKPKPETDVMSLLLNEHNITKEDLIIFGNNEVDEQFARKCGVDYISLENTVMI